MSAQPAVLQVVILRDGLLVGTEVFVPGSYVLGSADDADLRLDDAAVDPHHAVLYFQNGKAAVQDSGSVGGLYVNGHQVTACEIRSVDEVVLGPFVLKTRVLGPRTTPKTTPPPEVSALLGSVAPAAIPQVAPISAPKRSSAPPPPPAETDATAPAPYSTRGRATNGQVDGSGTVPSARRRKGKAPRNEDEPLGPLPSSVRVEPEFPPEAFQRPAAARPAPERPWDPSPAWNQPVAVRAPEPARPPPPPRDAVVPAAAAARPPSGPPRRVPAGATARGPQLFAVPGKGGRGRPRIYFELYWQNARQMARSFGPTSKKKPITSGLADVAMVPFYGFSMPEGFPVAESAG
ncbi:MAG TPA: FHA domain-containing protein, partial [Myxococcaceae bacterium]